LPPNKLLAGVLRRSEQFDEGAEKIAALLRDRGEDGAQITEGCICGIPVKTPHRYANGSIPLASGGFNVGEDDYLRAEAADGRREEFEAFLAAVLDAEPLETDRVE
jgi:hypothetical protein